MSTHEYRTGATAQSGALLRIASTSLQTNWGMFEAMGFEHELWTVGRTAETALALVLGDLSQGLPLLRVHSQCLTGEVFGSLRCDCGMQAIAQAGRGLVLYESQEGRGIGLMAKLQADELQDAGIDTIEANHALGFKADFRDFSLAAAILHDLRIPRVGLLTHALKDGGIEIVERLPCEIVPTAHSVASLQTKKQKMGHALSLEILDPGNGTPGIEAQL